MTDFNLDGLSPSPRHNAKSRAATEPSEAATSEASTPLVFTRTKEVKLRRFLVQGGDSAHIIAGQQVLDHLQAFSPTTDFSFSPRYDGQIGGRSTVYVLAPGELELVARVRADYPSAHVHSVKHDVLPALICGHREDLSAPPARADEAELKYAVICTPRSGSTYLCDLLSKFRHGAPIEHFRAPACHFLRARMHLPSFLQGLYRWGTVDRTFGTKLVHHYIFEAFPGQDDRKAFCGQLVEEGFRLIYLERDKIEQSVSQYFAMRTDIWHRRKTMAGRVKNRYEQIAYDYDGLLTRYQALVKGEDELKRLLEDWKAPVLHVDYADLDTSPRKTLRRIRAHLGVDRALPIFWLPGGLPRKISATVRLMHDHSVRFRQDLSR